MRLYADKVVLVGLVLYFCSHGLAAEVQIVDGLVYYSRFFSTDTKRRCRTDNHCLKNEECSTVFKTCFCRRGYEISTQFERRLCVSKSVGSSCEDDSDCPFEHGYCSTRQVCACNKGYTKNPLNNGCSPSEPDTATVYKIALIIAAVVMIIIFSVFIGCVVKRACDRAREIAARRQAMTQDVFTIPPEFEHAEKPPTYREVLKFDQMKHGIPPPEYSEVPISPVSQVHSHLTPPQYYGFCSHLSAEQSHLTLAAMLPPSLNLPSTSQIHTSENSRNRQQNRYEQDNPGFVINENGSNG